MANPKKVQDEITLARSILDEIVEATESEDDCIVTNDFLSVKIIPRQRLTNVYSIME